MDTLGPVIFVQYKEVVTLWRLKMYRGKSISEFVRYSGVISVVYFIRSVLYRRFYCIIILTRYFVIDLVKSHVDFSR